MYYVRELALQIDNLREVEVSLRRGVSELISQYAHVLFEPIQTEPRQSSSSSNGAAGVFAE